MSDIAKLTVALYANSAQFTSELKESRNTAKNWSDSISKTMSIAAKATAGASVAAAGSLALVYNQQAELIDQTAKFADRIGISTEALSQFRHAAELTGVGSKNLDMSLQRMTRRISEAAQGSGEAAPALKQLGLDAQALGQMTPDQQLYALSDAFTQVESQSDRVRLAFKLFDSEGVGMVNMLSGGSAGLREMANEADQLGITLSRIDAAKVEAANDSMYKISAVTSAMSRELTTQLAPIVEAVANEFVTAAKNAGGFNVVMADSVETVVKGFGWMGTAFRGWEIIFATLNFRVTELAYTIQSSIQSASDFVHEAGKQMFSPIMEGIWQALDSLGTFSIAAQQAADNMRMAMDAPSPKVFDDLPEITLEYSKARWELQKLLAEPLPHDQADAWLKRVRQNAEKAAKAIAEKTKDGTSDGASLTDSNAKPTKEDPAVAAFKKATAQIEQEWQRRLAINAAGDQADFARESFAYDDRTGQLTEQYDAAIQAIEDRKNTIREMLKGDELSIALAEQNQVKKDTTAQYYESLELMWQEHQANITDIEKKAAKARNDAQQAAQLVQLRNYSDLFGSMADVAGTFAGEQSGIFKAMFAASKAFSIAESIVKIQQGIANAAALPFPANIGAMATVASTTAGIVSTIKGTNLQGMAHNGISSVPNEGTWLLDKGERVYTNDSAKQLDQMYSAVMAGKSGQSSPANVVVNLIEDASRAGTVEQSNDGDMVTLDIRVAKLLQSSSTQTSQVMQTRYRTQQYGS
ncbi:hypothetical protein [Vibrio alginolyticus]|uniref:hypothetical protein n=1 Tax=Vibrio alginolyticus TaxID=663 RepID=UPI001BD37C6E|nr:hypothetical protein [Vibrio alginolyticus]MBS9903248.1 hypothetical protein [Vibrio alginolyticus]